MVRCQRETMQSRVVIEVMESSLQIALSFPRPRREIAVSLVKMLRPARWRAAVPQIDRRVTILFIDARDGG